jgi:hypothetical protein
MFTETRCKTLWDWLDLLVVPIVLALGGYLFTRSENQRTQKTADQERSLDREIANERRQDDTLQAYLDGMSQLLTDKERPLHKAQPSDSLSTVARARTLTVLGGLDGGRKSSVLQFLFESGLICKEKVLLDEGSRLIERRHNIVSLQKADLSEDDLSGVNLIDADLSGSYLSGSYLSGADLSGANLSEARALVGATMPDGQTLRGDEMPNGPTFEDWLKDKEARSGDGKKGGP